jgi:hypothetical protein
MYLTHAHHGYVLAWSNIEQLLKGWVVLSFQNFIAFFLCGKENTERKMRYQVKQLCNGVAILYYILTFYLCSLTHA